MAKIEQPSADQPGAAIMLEGPHFVSPAICAGDSESNRPLVPWWHGEGDPDGLLDPKRKLIRPFDLRELGYGWTACPIPRFDVTLLLMYHADTQEPAGFTVMYFDKLGLAQLNPRSFAEILGVNQQDDDEAGSE